MSSKLQLAWVESASTKITSKRTYLSDQHSLKSAARVFPSHGGNSPFHEDPWDSTHNQVDADCVPADLHGYNVGAWEASVVVVNSDRIGEVTGCLER